MLDAPVSHIEDDDWHPADIEAALKKRGVTLAGLSVRHGCNPTAVGKATRKRWPAVERIIAEAIGVSPQTIWPSRYGRVRSRKSDFPSKKDSIIRDAW
jgi:Ner family transcriptional regulator